MKAHPGDIVVRKVRYIRTNLGCLVATRTSFNKRTGFVAQEITLECPLGFLEVTPAAVFDYEGVRS